MNRQYKYRDVIEYLGVRYYVMGDVGEDWLCINGYSFGVCLFPKSKLSKLIGKSDICFNGSLNIEFQEKRKWGLNGLNQKIICHRTANQ